MNKKQRHLGRELALTWLYQIDIGKLELDTAMNAVPDALAEVDTEGQEFAELLTRGVWDHLQHIDEIIARFATGWSLTRMAVVERNILRLALYEINKCEDTPDRVTINEAIEIAKRYGDADSGKFVNGILGAYMRSEHSTTNDATE